MTTTYDITTPRGTEPYEALRRRYFNNRIPQTQPAEIACPRTTQDVVDAVHRASGASQNIGVRSGGHLFPCTSLVDDGLLIDTIHLNRQIEYDPNTKIISFGPACLSKELAEYLEKLGRFFPFGHSPTVAMGGFCLAGGQGWFMRGWGCTAESWVLKFEIVTADGRVVEASSEKNQDLWWAARGSGQGFFGVVTRIWGRTIPACRGLFQSTLVFNVTDCFEDVCKWMLDMNDKTPKYGVETAAATFYADRTTPPLGDTIKDRTVLMAVDAIAYADSRDEADTMLRPLLEVPTHLQDVLMSEVALVEKTWEQIFIDQENLNPMGGGERWQCDSILNNPDIPREEVGSLFIFFFLFLLYIPYPLQ
jgi:FAD/FMN-containing dehydrogenase